VAILVRAPQIDANSETMTITSIDVTLNDRVEKGVPLASLETMKTIMVIEAPGSGYVRKILIRLGEEVSVAAPMFVLSATRDEDVPDDLNGTAAKGESLQATPEVRVTLKARQLAEESGIDITQVAPSDGKSVRTADVLTFLNRRIGVPSPTSSASQTRKFTEFEKGAAQSLAFSKNEAIAAYLERVTNMQPLVDYAKNLQAQKSWMLDPLLPLLGWCYVQSILKNPALNTMCRRDEIYTPDKINLGFTIDVQGDLYIATVLDAGQYDQIGFVESFFQLQRKAMKRALTREEQSAATIGVSSLAAFGITKHQPLLLPNSSVMLAHSAPLPFGSPRGLWSTLGATYDHRIHNGAQIARTLGHISRALQEIK
jgi:pyruvate dehydrogenase E2 component (dihydrolipoamide acetyltransferase)